MLEAGMLDCPDSSWIANTYAWALATLPVDSLRNGEKAVGLAMRALSLSETEDDPSFLDTLAVAQAEAGNFEGARASAEQALRLAKRQGKLPPGTIAEMEKHLEGFRAGRAVRSP